MTNSKAGKAGEEIALINRFFKDYGINAAVSETGSHVAGRSYIVFNVSLRAGARITAIESRLRELAEILSAYRGQPTPIRLRHMPLALEVPHPRPQPVPLAPQPRPPHTMALGQSYGFDGSITEEVIDLSRTPHTLIAGATGSGKSVLLTAMLCSLTMYTRPQDLHLICVDMKNEDLVPFAELPHTTYMATDSASATEAIDLVHYEKEVRVRNGRRGTRMVVVIDELAELARMRPVMQQLASILAIGRSKNINVLAATQKPLGAIVGSVAKANFTSRLIGRVMSPDDSRVAAGISGVGAEYLPGQGAFLRVEGMDVRRFQGYYVEPDAWTQPILERWYQQGALKICEAAQ
jgi:S-DNA-T family DNA segregation ATPase FtsK/SpoIIIE